MVDRINSHDCQGDTCIAALVSHEHMHANFTLSASPGIVITAPCTFEFVLHASGIAATSAVHTSRFCSCSSRCLHATCTCMYRLSCIEPGLLHGNVNDNALCMTGLPSIDVVWSMLIIKLHQILHAMKPYLLTHKETHNDTGHKR